MKELSFKEWVESHNPKHQWDWADPISVERDLNQIISECGNLDLKTIVSLFWTAGDLCWDYEAKNWMDWFNA